MTMPTITNEQAKRIVELMYEIFGQQINFGIALARLDEDDSTKIDMMSNVPMKNAIKLMSACIGKLEEVENPRVETLQ